MLRVDTNETELVLFLLRASASGLDRDRQLEGPTLPVFSAATGFAVLTTGRPSCTAIGEEVATTRCGGGST